MIVRPSAAIRQNYDEIADICKKTAEPVLLMQNGEENLVVMDAEAFHRREKMLKLREELLSAEEAWLAEGQGYTIEEMDARLDAIIDKA